MESMDYCHVQGWLRSVHENGGFVSIKDSDEDNFLTLPFVNSQVLLMGVSLTCINLLHLLKTDQAVRVDVINLKISEVRIEGGNKNNIHDYCTSKKRSVPAHVLIELVQRADAHQPEYPKTFGSIYATIVSLETNRGTVKCNNGIIPFTIPAVHLFGISTLDVDLLTIISLGNRVSVNLERGCVKKLWIDGKESVDAESLVKMKDYCEIRNTPKKFILKLEQNLALMLKKLVVDSPTTPAPLTTTPTTNKTAVNFDSEVSDDTFTSSDYASLVEYSLLKPSCSFTLDFEKWAPIPSSEDWKIPVVTIGESVDTDYEFTLFNKEPMSLESKIDRTLKTVTDPKEEMNVCIQCTTE